MRAFIVLLCLVSLVSADTSTINKRIHQISASSLSSLQNKQIGVNTTADANLGFKMWGGKDADGNVTQFLCKSKNALMLAVRQDSSFSKVDTAWKYKGDTAYIGGMRADRFYFGVLTGSKTTFDTINTKWVTIDSCLKLPLRLNDCIVDGALWYQENHGSMHSYIDGVVGSIDRTLFIQTNTVLDSNSTVETSMIGTGVNHILDSFPSRYYLMGKTHHIIASGVYSTLNPNPDTLLIRIKLNATVICSTNVVLDPGEVNQRWKIEGYLKCIDTGTGGKMTLSTGFEHTIAGVKHEDPLITTDAGTTVNTTIKQKLGMTFKFSKANAANKIKSRNFIVEELH